MTVVTALPEAFPALTVRENADTAWAVHDCGYRPLVTGGRLVKKYDPAWQMFEVKNRDYGCLTERVRMRAKLSPDHRRHPGYQLGVRHVRISKGEDYNGYPDFHIWSDHGDMFRELKRMGEVPGEAQAATLTRLHRPGRDVGVWWPCCWFSGRIDWELAALARRPRIGRHGHPGLPAQPGEPGYAPGPVAVLGGARPPVPKPQSGRDPIAWLAGDGPAVTGYVLVGGPVSAAAAEATIVVRQWLGRHLVSVLDAPWPLRIVDAGSVVFVQTVTLAAGRREWRAVVPATAFPAGAAQTAAAECGSVVAHTDAENLKAMIEAYPRRSR